MLLENAMIVWTPNRGLYDGKPNKGQIAVTTIPEADALRIHPMSAGACDHNWREADNAIRRQLLQRYFTQIIHRDGLEEATVRKALQPIEDVNIGALSAAPPDGDDWY